MSWSHIGHTFSSLICVYKILKKAKVIWEVFDHKCKTKEQGADKFLIKKYFDFTCNNGASLFDHVHDLHVLVSKLKDLGVEISKSLHVGPIIAKLTPSWNDYQKK